MEATTVSMRSIGDSVRNLGERLEGKYAELRDLRKEDPEQYEKEKERLRKWGQQTAMKAVAVAVLCIGALAALVTGQFSWFAIAVVVGLVALGRYVWAAVPLVIVSLLMAAAFLGTGNGPDGWPLMLVIVTGAALLSTDKRSALVMLGYVVLAFLGGVVIRLFGSLAEIFGDGFAVDQMVHLWWIGLAVVPLGYIALQRRYASLVLAAVGFTGVGYWYFVYGYAGFRWQRVELFGDYHYHHLLVVSALLLAVAVTYCFLRKPEVAHAEQDLLEDPVMGTIFEEELKVPAVTADGKRFRVPFIIHVVNYEDDEGTYDVERDVLSNPDTFERYVTQYRPLRVQYELEQLAASGENPFNQNGTISKPAIKRHYQDQGYPRAPDVFRDSGVTQSDVQPT